MKIVTLTEGLSNKFSIPQSVKLIKEVGFDGFDLSMFRGTGFIDELKDKNYIKFVKDLKKLSDDIGLPCLQAHAPDPKTPNEITPEDYVELSKKAIEIASEMGCEKLVVHPGNRLSDDENIELVFSKLIPFAEKSNVVVCTENMFGWKDSTETETVPESCGTSESFCNIIDKANSKYLKGCLDLGHAQMVNCEGAVSMIKKLGAKRIACLHVHDNDLFNDNHEMPFIGNSDWNEIMTALKEIGYNGHFTFEACATFYRYPKELIPSLLKLLADTGRYLVRDL